MSDLALAENTQSQGKFIILVAQGDEGDTNRQKFAFASYLLDENGKAAFRYCNEDVYNQVWLYANTDNVQLGAPLSHKRVKNTPCWRLHQRLCSCGSSRSHGNHFHGSYDADIYSANTTPDEYGNQVSSRSDNDSYTDHGANTTPDEHVNAASNSGSDNDGYTDHGANPSFRRIWYSGFQLWLRQPRLHQLVL